MALVERVERVEELLLRAVAAGEEVDVVDDQQVDVAVAMAELVHVAGLDGVDELVDEAVAGQIEDARRRLALEHLLADGLQQVRLAQPDAAVDEQRVVRLARLLGDGDARGVRQAVARAGDEVLERVIRVERQRLVAFVEDAAAAGRLSQWKLTATSRPVTCCAAAVNGCWHWLWQKLSWAGGRDGDLDDAVGQLPRRHLVEPDAVEGGVVHADGRQDALPDPRVQRRRTSVRVVRCVGGGVHRAVRQTGIMPATDSLSRRRMGQCHGEAGYRRQVARNPSGGEERTPPTR